MLADIVPFAGRRSSLCLPPLRRRFVNPPGYRTVQVHGRSAGYIIAGEGPPVVLLHGLGESCVDWLWILPALMGNYTVITPDLPGSGESELQDNDATSAGYERFVIRLLDVLNIDRTLLIGHSFGGLLAARIAAHHPQRIRAMALLAPAGVGKEINVLTRLEGTPLAGDAAAAWAMTPWGSLQRAWLRASVQIAVPARTPWAWISEQWQLAQSPAFLQTWLRVVRIHIGPMGQRESVRASLDRTDIPALLLWGTKDRIVPISQAYDTIPLLRQGRLAVLEGCGHLSQIEKPRAVLSHLLPFMQTVERTDRASVDSVDWPAISAPSRPWLPR